MIFITSNNVAKKMGKKINKQQEYLNVTTWHRTV